MAYMLEALVGREEIDKDFLSKFSCIKLAFLNRMFG